MEKPTGGKAPSVLPYDYGMIEKKEESKDRTLQIALPVITTVILYVMHSSFVFTCLTYGSLAIALALLAESNLGKGHPYSEGVKASGYWTPQGGMTPLKGSPDRKSNSYQQQVVHKDEFHRLHDKFNNETPIRQILQQQQKQQSDL